MAERTDDLGIDPPVPVDFAGDLAHFRPGAFLVDELQRVARFAGCQTGVTNQFGGICGDGCSLQDCINNCGVGVTNHGQYVSCVAHLTNDLKAQGIITGRDKGRIQRCAAKAKPHPAPSFIRIVGERG